MWWKKPNLLLMKSLKLLKIITTFYDWELYKSIFTPALMAMVRLASFFILLCNWLKLKKLHVDIPGVEWSQWSLLKCSIFAVGSVPFDNETRSEGFGRFRLEQIWSWRNRTCWWFHTYSKGSTTRERILQWKGTWLLFDVQIFWTEFIFGNFKRSFWPTA